MDFICPAVADKRFFFRKGGGGSVPVKINSTSTSFSRQMRERERERERERAWAWASRNQIISYYEKGMFTIWTLHHECYENSTLIFSY
jgi:hypothetical protein